MRLTPAQNLTEGDTITVLDSTKKRHKIRISGINAPESKQVFGQASKKHLSNLVFNRDLTLYCSKIDRHKRHLDSTNECNRAAEPFSGPFC